MKNIYIESIADNVSKNKQFTENEIEKKVIR